MTLEDLNKNLYDPESETKRDIREKSRFDPKFSRQGGSEEFQKKEVWVREKKGLSQEKKKIIKWGLWALGGVVFLALIIVAVVKIRQSAFSEEKVSVNIEGPAGVDSTQPARYVIRYRNDNRVDLKNVSVILNYAENFQPETATNLQIINNSNSKISVGTIQSHSEGEIELKGIFYAPSDYVVYLRAKLEYTPSNFNSVFQAQGQLGVNVKTSPIFLEIAAPLEAADGNSIEYLIDYKNLSSRYFGDVRIRTEYPDGFKFASSDPKPSEGNDFWYVGNLNPGQEGKIKIEGTIQGSGDEGKIVKAYAGSAGEDGRFVIYTQNEKNTRMVSSPLSIAQSVNSLENLTVNAGEELRYVLVYRNEGETGMRDVIITLSIESPVLDFSKLRLDNGSYSSSRKEIIWKASDLSSLANLGPGEGGEIRFAVPVLDRIPVKNRNDKNFTIVSTAKIDSPDVPAPAGSSKIISSNTIEMKLNSKIVLETKGYYNDSAIANSGPIPPETGKETSYTIHWRITNVSNDVAETKIVSSLPSGVKWAGKINPESEKITYNERTNQIIWEIGKLDSGTGILDPKREIGFQLSIIPQDNQRDQVVRLLNASVLTAKDLFTGGELRIESGEKTTALPEDESIGGKYKVAG